MFRKLVSIFSKISVGLSYTFLMIFTLGTMDNPKEALSFIIVLIGLFVISFVFYCASRKPKKDFFMLGMFLYSGFFSIIPLVVGVGISFVAIPLWLLFPETDMTLEQGAAELAGLSVGLYVTVPAFFLSTIFTIYALVRFILSMIHINRVNQVLAAKARFEKFLTGLSHKMTLLALSIAALVLPFAGSVIDVMLVSLFGGSSPNLFEDMVAMFVIILLTSGTAVILLVFNIISACIKQNKKWLVITELVLTSVQIYFPVSLFFSVIFYSDGFCGCVIGTTLVAMMYVLMLFGYINKLMVKKY